MPGRVEVTFAFDVNDATLRDAFFRHHQRLATVLLLWAAYGNWAITLLASMTGAKEFAPQAGAGFGAGTAVEKGTLLLILTVALSTLAGLGLVLSGVRRRE